MGVDSAINATNNGNSSAFFDTFARRGCGHPLDSSDQMPMAYVAQRLPTDFKVRGSFYAWRDDGLLDEINDKPSEAARLAEIRKAQPTAGGIDGQNLRTTESGGTWVYDAGKRIKGRKHHTATDRVGFLIVLVVFCAGTQNQGEAPDLLKTTSSRYPSLRHVSTDGGYAGPNLRDPLKALAKFATVHSSVHDLFNQKRHLYSPDKFKLNRTAARTGWRQLCSAKVHAFWGKVRLVRIGLTAPSQPIH